MKWHATAVGNAEPEYCSSWRPMHADPSSTPRIAPAKQSLCCSRHGTVPMLHAHSHHRSTSRCALAALLASQTLFANSGIPGCHCPCALFLHTKRARRPRVHVGTVFALHRPHCEVNTHSHALCSTLQLFTAQQTQLWSLLRVAPAAATSSAALARLYTYMLNGFEEEEEEEGEGLHGVDMPNGRFSSNAKPPRLGEAKPEKRPPTWP